MPVPTITKSALISLCLACTALAGCAPAGHTSIVLIDRSASIAPADRALYAQSLEALAPQLDAGGRVLVAAVGDAGRSDFLPLFDRRVAESEFGSTASIAFCVSLSQRSSASIAEGEWSRSCPSVSPSDESSPAPPRYVLTVGLRRKNSTTYLS